MTTTDTPTAGMAEAPDLVRLADGTLARVEWTAALRWTNAETGITYTASVEHAFGTQEEAREAANQLADKDAEIRLSVRTRLLNEEDPDEWVHTSWEPSTRRK